MASAKRIMTKKSAKAAKPAKPAKGTPTKTPTKVKSVAAPPKPAKPMKPKKTSALLSASPRSKKPPTLRPIRAKSEASEERWGGVSSSTVQARTNHTWEEWFQMLDEHRAHELDHKAIVALVAELGQRDGWWTQMIAVAFEQARGLREKNERAEGYAASVTRTIEAPLERVYDAVVERSASARWLREPKVDVHRATTNRAARGSWDGEKTLSFQFSPRGPLRCQLVIQQEKLGSIAEVGKVKRYWAQKLDALEKYLGA